jgi:hypothetical protein
MGIVSEVFDTVVSLGKKNIKLLLLLIVAALVLFPLLDSLVIKPLQIRQKIDILQKIGELDNQQTISPEAKSLRTAVNADIDAFLKNQNVDIAPVPRVTGQPWKFVSGASIWLLFFVILLFQQQKLYIKVLALILVLGIGAFLGYIGTLIPTLVSPWFNYIGYPIVQMVFLASLFRKTSAKAE